MDEIFNKIETIQSERKKRLKTLDNILNGVTDGSQLTLVRSPSYILTASSDCTAKLWNPEQGECVLTFKGHLASIQSAVFSPDAQQLLTVSLDDTVKLWWVASGECSFTLKPSTVGARIAAFSPDGQQVLTASVDCFAKLWSAASGECLRTFEGHRGCVRPAVFTQC